MLIIRSVITNAAKHLPVLRGGRCFVGFSNDVWDRTVPYLTMRVNSGFAPVFLPTVTYMVAVPPLSAFFTV